MAQQGDATVLRAYSAHELSSEDALESAAIAEQALAGKTPERCGRALAFGVECVASASRRRTDDHFHVPMQDLEETVERAIEALDADHDHAERRAQQAIAALRRTVATVENGAGTVEPGHRYL